MVMGGGLRYGPHLPGAMMTQIRMIADVAYPTGLLRNGLVYDMPAGEAEAMVIMGWAEYTDDDPVQVHAQQYDHVQALNPRRGETL